MQVRVELVVDAVRDAGESRCSHAVRHRGQLVRGQQQRRAGAGGDGARGHHGAAPSHGVMSTLSSTQSAPSSTRSPTQSAPSPARSPIHLPGAEQATPPTSPPPSTSAAFASGCGAGAAAPARAPAVAQPATVPVSPAAPPTASGALAPSPIRRLNDPAAVSAAPPHSSGPLSRLARRCSCGLSRGPEPNIRHSGPSLTQNGVPYRARKPIRPAPAPNANRPRIHGPTPNGPGLPGGTTLPFTAFQNQPRSTPLAAVPSCPSIDAAEVSFRSARSSRPRSPRTAVTIGFASGGRPDTSTARSAAASPMLRASPRSRSSAPNSSSKTTTSGP